VQSVSAFSAGSQRHALVTAGGAKVLPFLCYEVIFPGIAGNGEAEADVLFNATNDAWFGDTPGPYQHFRQAQIRAVEAGRPLVRAANNGISGVVDAYGRVIDAYAIDAVGILDVTVPRQRLSAPVRPDLAGWIVLLLVGGWAAISAVNTRRSAD
jgi:apolipoprotein N-acyltransferase